VLIVVSPSLPWRKEGHGVAAISDIDIVGRIRWDGASKAVLESRAVPVIAVLNLDRARARASGAWRYRPASGLQLRQVLGQAPRSSKSSSVERNSNNRAP
jgi:hypothetical protein